MTTTTQQDDRRNEWDVLTATTDGGVVWRRYGDHKIVTTFGSETPDAALAQIERDEKSWN